MMVMYIVAMSTMNAEQSCSRMANQRIAASWQRSVAVLKSKKMLFFWMNRSLAPYALMVVRPFSVSLKSAQEEVQLGCRESRQGSSSAYFGRRGFESSS